MAEATPLFVPTREDGRSDGEVVYEFVEGAFPGTIFTHHELLDELATGLPERPEKPRLYQAIQTANRRLLKRSQRYLHNVRGRGYKVLSADEHLPVALEKKESAEGYLKRGIALLRGARVDELTPAVRALTEGQLMIMVGFSNALRESSRRHERLEMAVDDLRARVDRLENPEE